jgi:hypothetical protein
VSSGVVTCIRPSLQSTVSSPKLFNPVLVCTTLPQDLPVPGRYTHFPAFPTLYPYSYIHTAWHACPIYTVDAPRHGHCSICRFVLAKSKLGARLVPRTVGIAHCCKEMCMSLCGLWTRPPYVAASASRMHPRQFKLTELSANNLGPGCQKAPSAHPHEVEGLPAGASYQPGPVTDRRPVPIAGRRPDPRVWQKVCDRSEYHPV